jgi:hypothetical protein
MWLCSGSIGKVTSGSTIGDVLLSVRTVRNNVCHGGKFPDGVVIEPLRDEAFNRPSISAALRVVN